MRKTVLMRGGYILLGCFAVLALLFQAADAQTSKKTLVVALNQDPDILDPSLSRTYVGRIVYEHMCEKLYELDENLKIFPQLAAELPAFSDGGKTVTIKLRSGVKFNDGTPMNAEAVRYSIDRHLTMKGSARRSELESVAAIEVVDPMTVRLRLKAPFSPIVATLADRAGMPVSPDPGQEARGQVRHRPGLRGTLEVRRARPAGPDRPGEVQALLRSEPGQVRPDRVPDHRGRQRPAGQPALGRHRHDASGRTRPTPPA